jgi:hypothetical protein
MAVLFQRAWPSFRGWRSWRPLSEICFRFHRRTLMKGTGATGQRIETARHLSWKSWIENTERFYYPARESDYLAYRQFFRVNNAS